MKLFRRYSRIIPVTILFAAVIFSFYSTAYAQSSNAIKYEEYVAIPALDGTKLAASLAMPSREGKFPTVIIRSPYGSRGWKGSLESYAKRGYACLIQDTRGQYDSEGVFDPFVTGIDDGDATLRWVRSQPWSNGKIGASGHSYVGFTALYLAAGKEEDPDAIVVHNPVASPVGGLYRGGAMIHHFDYYWSLLVDFKEIDLEYIFSLNWDNLFGLLPLADAHRGVNREIKHYRNWVEWANGSFGKGILPDPAQISGDKTAFLLVGGWFDLFGRDVINLFNQLSRDSSKEKVKMIIGPYDHSQSPPPASDMEFGDWSSLNVSSVRNQWLDRWILDKDNGAEKRPAVAFFLLGENRWISSDTWPPANVSKRSFYLHSKGSANSSNGDGHLDESKSRDKSFDQFIYDPGDPVPTKGGILCCLRRMTKAGPMDQSEIEKRNDVLVYTTDILTDDITIAGPVELELFASTSARDTDFTGKLIDVYPDGQAMNITDGIIRARFRNGMGKPQFITPDKVEHYRIELGHTAITFKKGHRIRLEVSSSNFPRFDRNMNTGGTIGTESKFKKAEQKVYHDKKRLSRLILPVLDKI